MEGVWHRNHATQAEGRADIIATLVSFYKSGRLNFVLDNLSPAVFERDTAAKKPIAVSAFTWPARSRSG